MIIEFEGRTWDIDPTKITVDEWRELKRKYKMTPKTWQEGIAEADPDASTFLYWLMLRRGGDMHTPLGDQLKPDIIALNAAIEAAQSDDDGQEDDPEPDPLPTSPAGAASPAPVSQPTTTPPLSPPGQAGSANGGTATSRHSAPNTSAPWPTSATYTSPIPAGSP